MKVVFRSQEKHKKLFVLNAFYELDYVPVIGDLIIFKDRDFQNATYRVKPWKNDNSKIIAESVYLNFTVIKRTLDIRIGQWELICEPTAESVLFLLKNIKTK